MDIIPEIDYSLPEEEMMPEQLEFYNEVENSLNKGNFIEVGINDWYIDLYIHKYLHNVKELSDIEEIRNKLLHIDSLYPVSKYAISAKQFADECLIALKRYDEYLVNSQNNDVTDDYPDISSELRLNVQKLLGIPADALDIYRLQKHKQSNLIQENPEKFKEYLYWVYTEYSQKHGGWFNLIENKFIHIISIMNFELLNSFLLPRKYKYPFLEFKTINYAILAFGADGLNSILRPLNTKAENLLRKDFGMKPKEVAWFMETYLFERIQQEFPDTEVIQHGKPVWLEKQHYDIWLPEWKIAVEFHGPQHFEPIAIWGGEVALKDTKIRDQRKISLSIENGVELIITSNQEFGDPIAQIKQIIKNKSQNSYIIDIL